MRIAPPQRRALTLAATAALGCGAGVELACQNWPQANALGLAATAALLTPTLLRNCPWFGEITTGFQTADRKFWLTIDDGPSPETPQILEVLEKHNAQATFFCIGNRVERWPEHAVAAVRAGHQVQNHTFGHNAYWFWAAGPRWAAREITKANETIFSTTGVRPTLFRCPAGLGNPFVHAAAERAGLRMVGWSASAGDGISHDPEQVPGKIARQLSPGAIILLHEAPLAGMPAGTRAATLDTLLGKLRTAGYQAVIPAL